MLCELPSGLNSLICRRTRRAPEAADHGAGYSIYSISRCLTDNAFGLSCGPSRRSYFWLSKSLSSADTSVQQADSFSPPLSVKFEESVPATQSPTASAPADAQGGAVSCCVIAPPRPVAGPQVDGCPAANGTGDGGAHVKRERTNPARVLQDPPVPVPASLPFPV
jgi:hypothetical protein